MAGHIASSKEDGEMERGGKGGGGRRERGRETRERQTGRLDTFHFSFTWGPQPVRWYHPLSRWGLTISVKPL